MLIHLNPIQAHLLAVLGEEFGEVAFEALTIAAAISHPERMTVIDMGRLVLEINDLFGALEIAGEYGISIPGALSYLGSVEAAKYACPSPPARTTALIQPGAVIITNAALDAVKMVFKAQRFGLDDEYRGEGQTPRNDIADSLRRVMEGLWVMHEHGVPMPGLFDRSAIDAKKAKIRQFMEYAQERGTLTA